MIICSYQNPTTNDSLTVVIKLGDVLTYITHTTRLGKLVPPHQIISCIRTSRKRTTILKFANIVRHYVTNDVNNITEQSV